jgi:hypothetical protein
MSREAVVASLLIAERHLRHDCFRANHPNSRMTASGALQQVSATFGDREFKFRTRLPR